MKIHEKYLKRCIELAKNGLGSTYPNPMVGSVIVHDSEIIGEGWHQKAGEAHAEVNAINSVKNKELLKSATIYVSLEPCSHYGKTPPCSNLIIDSEIKKVVIGTVDPFSEVAGRGIKKLFEAGCKVNVGLLEAECAELNRRFFTFHTQKRPFIILKWAQSKDGFISPGNSERSARQPVWISNRYSKQLVHKWRSEEAAILVGTNTAVADNPSLTTRLWHGQNPVRLVLDRHLRVPPDSALFDGKVKTLVFTEATQKSDSENVFFENIDFSGNIPDQICSILYKHEIQSLIIEGGARTLQTFLETGLWDEARIFTGNSIFGKGIAAPASSGKLISEKRISSDLLKIYRHD